MRCTSPRTVGFHADGKTLSWSPKYYCKDYPTFQLPCGKCLDCRLEYASQWAIRCVHEAKMHEDNCFITLTYDDEHLEPKLNYKHFQDFMKRLRFANPNKQIGVFVTGEYGDINKRPHWHACIFNWSPQDQKPHYTSDRGDKVCTSETLSKLWGKGHADVGTLTYESAGYCARYAAKKLVHGQDQDHEFHPISKKSNKNAIGKKYLETYWSDVFNHGSIVIDGNILPIPRYYEKWLQKHQPDAWVRYVTEVKPRKYTHAMNKAEKEAYNERIINQSRIGLKGPQITKNESRRIITESRMKQLRGVNKC